MKFRATIQLSGKTATGIPVPEEVVTGLGSSKKPAVKVTIGHYTYRSTIASMKGQYMLPVSSEHRTAAGVSAGDEVDVEVELDTEPRVLEIPPDFAAVLDREVEAKRFFEGLSYSNRLRFTLSVTGAKTEETRQRRIEKAISLLREGRTM